MIDEAWSLPPGIVTLWRSIVRHGRRLSERLVSAVGATPHFHVKAVAASHVGQVRPHNEDYFLIVDVTGRGARIRPAGQEHRFPATGALLVVADGMGGAEAGEVASAMAANTIVAHLAESWRDRGQPSPGRLRTSLLEAMEIANREIHAYANERTGLNGMGTTATAAALLGDHVHVGHVGDSRGYVVRDGYARQLTRDHSLVQHLLDIGELTPEAAAASPHRNVLLRALGPQPEITVDLSEHCVRSGDVLVLCSDGLWSCVAEDELAAIVTAEVDVGVACERLVALANDRGGPDNITVLVARFERGGRERSSAPEVDATALTIA
jgi:serine/threonine protein phosphatase PrpC